MAGDPRVEVTLPGASPTSEYRFRANGAALAAAASLGLGAGMALGYACALPAFVLRLSAGPVEGPWALLRYWMLPGIGGAPLGAAAAPAALGVRARRRRILLTERDILVQGAARAAVVRWTDVLAWRLAPRPDALGRGPRIELDSTDRTVVLGGTKEIVNAEALIAELSRRLGPPSEGQGVGRPA